MLPRDRTDITVRQNPTGPPAHGLHRRFQHSTGHGGWDTRAGTFKWQANLPGGAEQTIAEEIHPDNIVSTTSIFRDGTKLARHETRLVRTELRSKHEFTNHPILDKYVGNWTYSFTSVAADGAEARGTGRMKVVRLASEPLVVYRNFKPEIGLDEIRLIGAKDDGTLHQVFAFADVGGRLVQLQGKWDDVKSTATWRGAERIGALLITEDFSVVGKIKTKLEFRNASKEKIAEGRFVFQRVDSGSDRD